MALLGCGGGGRDMTGAGGTTGTGGTSGGVCTVGAATGTLSIKIQGAPSAGGLVTLPETAVDPITADGTVPLPAGPHDVLAFNVAGPGSPIRTAYGPDVEYQSVCVRAGQVTTVVIRYALIPSSGKLWVSASNTPSGSPLLGYAPAALAATGSAAAAVVADSHGGDGFTFDPFGDIWVTGGTSADPPVARYSRWGFGTSGDKTPDLVIDSPSFGGSVPGPKVLAFDSQWNLWVSVVADNKVLMFQPFAAGAPLTGVTTPVATVERTGISAPAGIAVGGADDVWIAANGTSTLMRIDWNHRLTSGSGADLTITALTPLPTVVTLTDPLGIAFDFDGNLWVNYAGTIARLSSTDLQGTGSKTVTPAIQIITDVQSLPVGLAFDEDGGLWLAYVSGKFARLAPSQLTASGVVTPQVVISSADLGYAEWFAFYPAPARSALAHWLP